MIFHTASDEARPVRLNEWLRTWADESLHGKYGDEAWANYAIPLDDVENLDALSPIDLYDLAIRRIAAEAPCAMYQGKS